MRIEIRHPPLKAHSTPFITVPGHCPIAICIYIKQKVRRHTYFFVLGIGGGNGFLGPVGHRQMMNPSVMNLEHRPS